MNNEFDLFTKPGKMWNDRATREIHSHEKGFLASLVDDKGVTLDMSIVSVFDHLTEPRTVESYYVEAVGKTFTQWALMWDEYLLGCVTDQEGAERLLAYLKSNYTE